MGELITSIEKLIFDISQGSVETRLRCICILSEHFIANVSLSLSVKDFWKSINIWRSYDKNLVFYFVAPPCRR